MTLSSALGATKEEKLAKLFSKLPNNSFPTALQMGVDFTPGVFSWEASRIHFDFLGMGKPQRISVLRSDVEDIGYSGDIVFDFAPSAKNAALGERTEFIGTAHGVHNTPLWKKRAWNTLNEWCSPGNTFRMPVLSAAMRISAQAYARLTRMEGVYYFMPGEMSHHPVPELRGGMRVLVSRFVRHVAMYDEPHWSIFSNMTDETRGYLDVAWDMHLDGKKADFR